MFVSSYYFRVQMRTQGLRSRDWFGFTEPVKAIALTSLS